MTSLQRQRFNTIKNRIGIKGSAFLTKHYSSLIEQTLDQNILASFVKIDAYKSGLSRDFLKIRDAIYGKQEPAYDWNLSLMYLWITCELGYECKVVPSDNSKLHGSLMVNLVKDGGNVCVLK